MSAESDSAPLSSEASSLVEKPCPAATSFGAPLFLAAIWAQLYWALHPTWIHSQYYDYGWIVPPLACWFFWQRWKGGKSFLPPKASPVLLSIAFTGLALLFATLVFVRILERFDPIWRVPLILHTFVVCLATVAVLLHVRGPRASLAYLPLILFAATACPWPAGVENRIVGELTDALLSVSAPLSRAIGIPVELSGSALISEGRVVEIDEGCSGIRSFQSLLMAGLFVGEFLLLKWKGRILLVLLAMIVGFGANALRATALTWIFVSEGQATFDQLHNLVGFLAFGLAVGVLLICGRLMDRPARPGAIPQPT